MQELPGQEKENKYIITRYFEEEKKSPVRYLILEKIKNP